jgi:tetratricopeptide (TPR) repeat protein
MSRFERDVGLAAGELGLQGEEQWQRLRQQLELAEGFWLGFIFVDSPTQAAELRSRTTQLLKARAHATKVIIARSPDELRFALAEVFAKDSAEAGCVWIECIRLDAPLTDGTPGPWTASWDSLLLRANERREALRRQLSGGLLFAAPPEIKPRVRDAAPDLWSLRSLVVEVAARPSQRKAGLTAEPDKLDKYPDESSGSAPDADFALAEAKRRAARGLSDPRSVARALLQAVEGRLADGRPQRAVEIARRAVSLIEEGAPNDHSILAAALSALSRAEQENGDLIGARQHTKDEIRERRLLTDIVKDNAEALRNLSLALINLGDLYGQAGELVDARAAYEESLQLRRRLLSAYGESPQTLRDLSVSLNKLGDVQREAGELAGARAAYEESLQLCRCLLSAYGESPQTLRDLSVSLDRLGDVQREAGELAAARGAYEESLQLCRRLLSAYGESPQTLRDLSVSLDRLARMLRQDGDRERTKDAFEESLRLDRQVLKAYGPTPQALSDLSMSLKALADLRRESGDETGAKELYDELEKLRADSAPPPSSR